uniref:Uncharacterized protein n=1 Tax=Rhizophora mucronata TaxID=61149 RepID=A0A2P2QNE8_RHIMU
MDSLRVVSATSPVSLRWWSFSYILGVKVIVETFSHIRRGLAYPRRDKTRPKNSVKFPHQLFKGSSAFSYCSILPSAKSAPSCTRSN